MMAHANPGYVVSVLHDGKPLRESNRTAILPLNSEYVVRLKNKSTARCQVEIEIDGTDLTSGGRLILDARQTLDLDCFPDTRRKLKFVPLSNGDVQDPTSSENGIVRVKFYREYVPMSYWNVHTSGSSIQGSGTAGGILRGTNFTNVNVDGMQYGAQNASCSVNSKDMDAPVPMAGGCTTVAGATVEGGASNQNFVMTQGFMTELLPTVIELKLVGRIDKPIEASTASIALVYRDGKPELHVGGSIVHHGFELTNQGIVIRRFTTSYC